MSDAWLWILGGGTLFLLGLIIYYVWESRQEKAKMEAKSIPAYSAELVIKDKGRYEPLDGREVKPGMYRVFVRSLDNPDITDYFNIDAKYLNFDNKFDVLFGKARPVILVMKWSQTMIPELSDEDRLAVAQAEAAVATAHKRRDVHETIQHVAELQKSGKDRQQPPAGEKQ